MPFTAKQEAAAEAILDEVTAFWTSLGLSFPRAELSDRY